MRGFLLGYKLGGLKVNAVNAGSLGDGWKGASCVRGVSGGEEMASPKICRSSAIGNGSDGHFGEAYRFERRKRRSMHISRLIWW